LRIEGLAKFHRRVYVSVVTRLPVCLVEDSTISVFGLQVGLLAGSPEDRRDTQHRTNTGRDRVVIQECSAGF
jgi:hypothetical protein